MTAQSERIEDLELLRLQAATALTHAQELNETIKRSRFSIPLVDVVRIWNVQVCAENALKNLELKARGVSHRVRAA